jgi:hypothetical protein
MKTGIIFTIQSYLFSGIDARIEARFHELRPEPVSSVGL